jgi:hypothetical protein
MRFGQREERANRWLAWITRNRRLARDFERYASAVVAFIPSRHDPHHAQVPDQANPLFLNHDFSNRLLSFIAILGEFDGSNRICAWSLAAFKSENSLTQIKHPNDSKYYW